MKQILISLGVTLLVLLGCSKVESDLPFGSMDSKFDSSLWLDEKSSSPIKHESGMLISERERMLGDLVLNILPNSSGGEIIKLLGPSLETNYFKSVDKDLIYYMGPERDSYFGGVDSEWLLIWLDEKGNFEKYALFKD